MLKQLEDVMPFQKGNDSNPASLTGGVFLYIGYYYSPYPMYPRLEEYLFAVGTDIKKKDVKLSKT